MPMTPVPRVSVLMPLYRPDLRYLRAAVESIRAQTLKEWELLLVEDGGPSGTAELIRSLVDSRLLHHVRPGKTTLSEALNDGLARCRAPIVARMDADDLAAPERLERQLAYLEQHPETTVVGSAIRIIDAEGRIIGHRRLPSPHDEVAAALRRYNCVAHPSVMFRRDVVLAAGGYAPQLAEDYDLWCRLVGRGMRVENLPVELLDYRFHQDASKFSGVHDAIRATIDTKLRHFGFELTLRERIWIIAERMLLLLPPGVIVRLFRAIEYRESA